MNKKSIRDGIEIFPLLTFIALTKFFSLETKTNIGGWLVSWLIRLNRKFKRRITKNLELTMPHKDKADQKKFIIEFGRHIGITFTELIFNSEFQKNKDRFKYSHRDLSPLIKANQEGRPIMIISGHLGPWEAVRAVLKINNLTSGAIYKKNKNQFYEIMHLNAIKCGGEPVFATGLSGTKKMIKYLKSGGIVSIMLDQAANDGEFFEFLGVPAKTTTSIAKIALSLDALVIPAYALRSRNSRNINVFFENPVVSKSYRDMTAKLTKSIEKRVTENPTQWYWLHRRWKY